MTEQEVIEGKITRAQQVLDHIESPDFSQKKFLRLDQDVSDVSGAAQFLRNYARVGLIKERLLEVSLPKFQTDLVEIITQAEMVTQEVQVGTKHKLVFLEGNQVELDGRRIKFSPKEFKVLEVSARHVDEEVLVRDLSQEALDNPDPRKASLNSAIWSMKKKLNQPDIFDSKLASKNSWFKLQNIEVVWSEEEITPEEQVPQEPALTGVESSPSQFDSGVLVIPYEPTEDEQRSDEETKILQFVVEALSRNRTITFEELQKATSPESRIRTVAGKRQLPIYQAHELKEMFNAALRKFREESAILNLKEQWDGAELKLWADLQAVMRRFGNDTEGFTRAVKAMIDACERRFYNSLPEEERQRRILWIDL